MTESEKISYIKLCAIRDVGAATVMRLLRHFGSPEAVFGASKRELMQVEKIGEKTAEAILEGKNAVDVSKISDAMNRIGARYFTFKCRQYPETLNQIPDKPVGFYAIGDCDFSAPCIAIVGTRNCSVYGQTVARNFAAEFARAGYTVISGMARGIDAMAHLGAMEAGGRTIAVLGTGVDVVYPPENIELYQKIIKNGSVISEFPMGARADRQNFPIRNRIVAAMAAATVVVESDVKGGSMITARLAGEYGRDVFAVPGRIDSALSRGCNALIRDGATLASSARDVIDSLKFSSPVQMTLFDIHTPDSVSPANKKSDTGTPKTPRPDLQENEPDSDAQVPQNAPDVFAGLTSDESKLLKIIAREKSVAVDVLSELAQMPVRACLPALLMLEIKKRIKKLAGGTYTLP